MQWLVVCGLISRLKWFGFAHVIPIQLPLSDERYGQLEITVWQKIQVIQAKETVVLQRQKQCRQDLMSRPFRLNR